MPHTSRPPPPQPLYTEDWLGLRALDAAGRLGLLEAPGGHMQFSLDWFAAHVVEPFLR
jgi:palmitoyl-protein thioesterase